jgi:hypothetical protein
MRILKRVVISFVVILIVLLGIGFLLPREVHVERTTTIDAPAEVVFGLTNDLHQYEKWTPWGKDRDPTIVLEYGGAPAGKGAWYTWESEKLGAGKLEIVDSESSKSVLMLLTSREVGGTAANVAFNLEPIDSDLSTKVTWAFDADMGDWPLKRYVGLFMDKMLGGDFEKGLANMKAVAEQESTSAK